MSFVIHWVFFIKLVKLIKANVHFKSKYVDKVNNFQIFCDDFIVKFYF